MIDKEVSHEDDLTDTQKSIFEANLAIKEAKSAKKLNETVIPFALEKLDEWLNKTISLAEDMEAMSKTLRDQAAAASKAAEALREEQKDGD